MLSTHIIEYIIMITFMAIYSSCGCFPDKKTADSEKGSGDDSSGDDSTDSEPRSVGESMYFALTTQTTVGCAGAQHAHAWRVARAIARARCAFLERIHTR